MTDREAIEFLAESLEALIDGNPYAAPRDFGRALSEAENALRTIRAREAELAQRTKPQRTKP